MNQNPDPDGLLVLDRGEALRLAATRPYGHFAYSVRGTIVVHPVNFVIDGDHLVLRTGSGSKLGTGVRRSYVTVQVDEIDVAARTGWTVTIIGHAELVTDPRTLDRLRTLDLHPWAPGTKEYFIRVEIRHVAGRRLTGTAALPAELASAGALPDPPNGGPA